ncbi:MAG TPA: beta-ketoacyl-[acyl-carrier-protein] synthase family protein [Chloroflexota bacterium]|nr:beta-ketoacyl-[acyl-carrier-protein] synthase family protein [Chloroflexota bacterium]
MRRAVITGIGAVTAIGIGVEELWAGVRRGQSAIRLISRFDPTPFRSHLGAEVDDFDPMVYTDARALRRLDRFAQFAVAAASLALDDAGLDRSRVNPARAGVSLGSALGGIAYGEDCHREYLVHGARSIPTALALSVYGGAGGAQIAIEFGLRGPSLANASSCASGAVAIGDALHAIRAGDADLMLAGGCEVPLAPLTFGAFSVIKAMSTHNHDPAGACRPFDADRDGFVMAEGSAVLVVEEEGAAQRRGARIYAELAGFGRSNDAYHMTAPRPSGDDAARAVCLALRDAGVEPDAVGYVNAHATGTPLGDAAESRALTHVLGSRVPAIPVSSTKALYGHALGASGAIEAAITALALHHGILPGSANLNRRDPDCSLTILSEEASEHVDVALTTSFGFGGINAALVLRAAS